MADLKQIWTTYLYTEGEPRYVLAMSVNCGFALLGIVLSMVMRLVLIRANKKLARAESELAVEEPMEKSDAISDARPEVETRGFRYVT